MPDKSPIKSPITPKQARLLMDMLMDLFDDYSDNPMKSAVWLSEPNHALGGRAPVNVIYEDEDGYQQVINLIGRLQHGIPL
jgi:uncharacterized protein (DUF2384 family)